MYQRSDSFTDPRFYPQRSMSMFEDRIDNNLGNLKTDLLSIRESVLINMEENDKIESDAILVEKIHEGLENADCIFNDLRKERYMIQHQNLMGMTVTSGNVVLNKDEKNLIGISIGGGAPLCPCLYIVQIFDNTPASKDGTLQSGDELVGVNGQTVKGKTKVEVAKMIQSAKDTVTINYNKLHADPKQGKSLDIIMKKVKHRLVENMSTGTADALGLSRAILCNDTLVAKLNEMRETENTYKKLVEHAKRMLKSYFDLLQTYKSLGDIFSGIGVREPQARASEAFTRFGQYHRLLERDGIKMLKSLKPILADMGTYLHKAIPDTKLTIRKYADTKFEYLSYCLKVKEMDDEEYGYNALQEPLYRVETGNYEYRLILRCRQDARTRFARLRSDVLVKLELLDNKKTQDVAYQLRRFIQGLAVYLNETVVHLKENSSLFPVEVDLSQNAFQYKSTEQILQDSQDDDEEIEFGKEIQEYHDISDEETKDSKVANRLQTKDKDDTDSSEQLLPGLTALALDSDSNDNAKNDSENLTLLTELGLVDTRTDDFGDFQNGLLDEFLPKSNMGLTDDVFDKLLNDLNIRN
ncbi:PRKCA-binding protein isoform X1 [Pararge aegeria]|uniref:PRKCA-binding protein isoform X1 n=2 Tax=Pararge aegeria TaxID=116150 RepID=UPI0019D171AE|nr:PRKCA-binding protein isoform X1 [Pararge aegeria]XP_039749605.1 PRKCA-binding protein isoform X1 [Pararge aegeria]XP_039749615.1 PRKCA-binding protein isoform X1 [Pararge aegeria]